MNHYLIKTLLLIVTTSYTMRQQSPSPFQIDTDFPGGNVIVVNINGDSVQLEQYLRDTEGKSINTMFSNSRSLSCEKRKAPCGRHSSKALPK